MQIKKGELYMYNSKKSITTKVVFNKENSNEIIEKAVSFLVENVNGEVTRNGNIVVITAENSTALKALMDLKLNTIYEVQYTAKWAGNSEGTYVGEISTIDAEPFIEVTRYPAFSSHAKLIYAEVNF